MGKPTDSVVTYEGRDGRHATTHVTKEQRAVLERSGRLIEDHGHNGRGKR